METEKSGKSGFMAWYFHRGQDGESPGLEEMVVEGNAGKAI